MHILFSRTQESCVRVVAMLERIVLLERWGLLVRLMPIIGQIREALRHGQCDRVHFLLDRLEDHLRKF